MKRLLRALTLQQHNDFLYNFLRCLGGKERREMVNQLLERFGIQKLQKQPKSKSEKVHKHRIKTIEKYVVPPPSTPKATKFKFSQEPPELQTFNEEKLVTKIEWSWKGTIVGCERSILKQVRGWIRTAEWQKEKRGKEHYEPSQQPPATSPPINRARQQAEWKKSEGSREKQANKAVSSNDPVKFSIG